MTTDLDGGGRRRYHRCSMRAHLPVLVFVVLSALPAAGRAPWRPQASIDPTPAAGELPAELDAARQQRFADHLQRGRRLLDRGQYRQAQPLLERAVRLAPEHIGARQAHARALLTLGYLHWNRALVLRARQDVRCALWLAPRRPALIQLVALLEQLLRRMDRLAGRVP
jgi:tetratricopeptide (TPR) repeat protein